MFPNLFFLFQNENVRAWAGPYKSSLSGDTVTEVQTCNLVQEASPSLSLYTGAQGWHSGLTSVFPAPTFLGRGIPQTVDDVVHVPLEL